MQNEDVVQVIYPAISVQTMQSHCYTVPITDEISSPYVYDEVITLLMNAQQGDEFKFLINSHGGSLDSLTALLNAIEVTEAHVHGILIGCAYSAASALFLACHTYEVGKMTSLMCHQVSYGNSGGHHSIVAQVNFISRQNERFIRENYTNFLTETEITAVLSGADLYFDDAEIVERLNKREELRNPESEISGEVFLHED